MPDDPTRAGEAARLAAECDRLAHRLNQHRAALVALLACCDEEDQAADWDARHAYLETAVIRAFVDPEFRRAYLANLRDRIDGLRDLGLPPGRLAAYADQLAALDGGGTLTPAYGWKAVPR